MDKNFTLKLMMKENMQSLKLMKSYIDLVARWEQNIKKVDNCIVLKSKREIIHDHMKIYQ